MPFNGSTINSYDVPTRTKVAISPDEVDIHEVMIASEKARLSVSLFKTVVDKAIKAYNDIMMIR
jgi:flagellar hook-basal body complex protein FliE